MISFKSFVNAIHDAIMKSSDALMDKNLSLLDKYFETQDNADQKPQDNTDQKAQANTDQKTLVPKTVVLEYPHTSSTGEIEMSEIHVPLITLIPLNMPQIEKTTITTDFEMEVVDGELQLNFISGRKGLFTRNKKKKAGKLEIVLSPAETPEGLKILVESYEAVLKRQIS